MQSKFQAEVLKEKHHGGFGKEGNHLEWFSGCIKLVAWFFYFINDQSLKESQIYAAENGKMGRGKVGRVTGRLLQFFLFCFVYLCLFIIFRSESWRCRFDSLLFDSYRCHTIDS